VTVKQFDVLPNPFPRSRSRQPFLVSLQSDLLSQDLDTVVVAPLELAEKGKFADRLNPGMTVEGKPYVLMAQEIVTVRRSLLGAPRSSLAHERGRIIAALDLLFTGF
jgi:toxin CcdB